MKPFQSMNGPDVHILIKQMILPKDLLYATVLSKYMKYSGYQNSLYTDCLTIAHLIRRIEYEVTTKTILYHVSHLLDQVFQLYLKPGEILSGPDMRLYIRVFLMSRFPSAAKLWNTISNYTELKSITQSAYDVVNAENAIPNETYLYFCNETGSKESEYIALPQDILKSIFYRRTLEVKTFSNAIAKDLRRIVYSDDFSEALCESNTQPLKVYGPSEVDSEAFMFLSGKLAFVEHV